MQAHQEEHAVCESVEDQPDATHRHDEVAELLNGSTNWWPDEASNDTSGHRRERRDDWYEASACEEAEVARQLRVLVVVVRPCGDHADQDAAEDRHVHLCRCLDLVQHVDQ